MLCWGFCCRDFPRTSPCLEQRVVETSTMANATVNNILSPLKPPFACPSQDVDKMPMRDLHQVISSPKTYTRLLQLCRGGELLGEPRISFVKGSDAAHERLTTASKPPTFVAIPALEFVGAISPDDPRIEVLLQARDDSKRWASDLVASGALRAFHAENFPEGHRQTNLDRWATLPADAAPYEVKHAEGYEPYGLFFRRHAPTFDERFRGFGLDKVRANPTPKSVKNPMESNMQRIYSSSGEENRFWRGQNISHTKTSQWWHDAGVSLLASSPVGVVVSSPAGGVSHRLAPPSDQA